MAKFNLKDLIYELRTAAAGEKAKNAVRNIMSRAFADPAAIGEAVPKFENDDEILFEDDSVSIWCVRFPPGLHVPPHDHQTWATIGVFEGAEINHFYLRESGRLLHKNSRRVQTGDVIAIGPDAIHSVEAADGKPCRGIHVYLAALTRIERSLFDWETGAENLFTDENYDALKRVVSTH